MNDTRDPPQRVDPTQRIGGPRHTGLQRLSQELIETVDALGGAGEIPSLERLVEVAGSTVTSADSVSLTSLRHGRFTTPAATDDLSRRGDALQYALGSGPCVDAVLDSTLYRPEDLAHDPRWPTFGQRAHHELGIRSMLAFRLYTDSTDSIDGLNFYSRTPDAFSDDDVVRGLLLATQAALAITRTKADHLTLALANSREISAAVGILMAAERLPYDKAFDLLRVASQGRNRALRDIAHDVVLTGTLEIPHLA
ncbi:MAG: ANTAR domain-containing protein [Actinomycetota bacterium]|nr:ANTAR domain-containing protein [Actinomycetota bacterium]